MRDIVRINRDNAIFVAIDYQQKLSPAIAGRETIEKNTVKLIRGLKTLGVPVIVTTQYAKGLGETVEPVAQALGEFEPVDKTFFSAYKEEACRERLAQSGRKTVVLAGMETHICVLQTALDLLENGYKVLLAADCCGSRDLGNHNLAVMRLSAEGAAVTNCESVLYEITENAKAAEFKEISKIVK